MVQAGDNAPLHLRGLLSQQIAGALNDGTNHVRVRIYQQEGVPQRASLLAHRQNQWHEVNGNVMDAAQLPALREDMEMLAANAHVDEVAVRQTVSTEMIDTDLQFHNDWVVRHRGGKLASAVEGRLFRDSHGSGQDVRRQSRTPRRGN